METKRRKEEIAASLKLLASTYVQYEYLCRRGPAVTSITVQSNSKTTAVRPWTRGTVREVLTNEKYIGNNVYNRTSFKLKKKNVRNSPDMWVRKDGAFDPVVSADLFFTARGIFLERNRRFSNEEMLAKLHALIEENATISASLIDAADGVPSSAAYHSRFGSLVDAYRLAGHVPERDYSYVEVNRHLRSAVKAVVSDTDLVQPTGKLTFSGLLSRF